MTCFGKWIFRSLCGALAGFGARRFDRADADEPKLEYNRDIRPILAENCFACHGPDSAARKADLRLDLREVAVDRESDRARQARRERADSPHCSRTIRKSRCRRRRRRRRSRRPRMQTLQQWIAEGAEYQPHWSLIAPARPEPPAVKNAALGAEPDRQLHPGEAGSRRAGAGRPRPIAARWPAA